MKQYGGLNMRGTKGEYIQQISVVKCLMKSLTRSKEAMKDLGSELLHEVCSKTYSANAVGVLHHTIRM
jgi:hypothetical protein